MFFDCLIFLINSCQFDTYATTEDNYGEEVTKYAEEFDLPQAYLNTGSPSGRKYNKNYVQNGLEHINYFSN